MRDPYWDGILSFAHKSHATSNKAHKKSRLLTSTNQVKNNNNFFQF